MPGGSDDDGAGTTVTRNYDLQIARSPHLLLMAEMGGRPTKPNVGGIDDATAMSHQVLEWLGRQMGSYGVHIYKRIAVDCHGKHNEVRFGT